MERKQKFFVLLLAVIFPLSVVPLAFAQTCNPDALVPVSFGQRGSAVRNAQACLIEAGYDIPAGATGYYGAQTRAAVRAFYADWYGSWHGNRLGPQGVEELRSMLAKAPEEEQPAPGGATAPSPTPGLSPEVLAQALALIQQGKANEALVLLLGAAGGMQTTTPTPTVAEEGLLYLDKNPTPPSGQQFREGETVTWLGARFRAQDSDISVKSFRIVWPTTNNVAPTRILSKLEIVDDQGNVLRTIDPASFTQDVTTLDYYVFVTGLDYVVPKNAYRPIFVRATAVSTFPTGSIGSKTLNLDSVRGRDTAGVDRYPSGTTSVNNTVLLQSTLATSAYFVVSRTADSPLERNVLADDPTNGRANGVEMLKFSLLAKNDNLKLQQLSIDFADGGSNLVPSTVFLYEGSQFLDSAVPANNGNATFSNLISQNIVVNRDQSRTFRIVADFTNVTASEKTASVSVLSVTRRNSLGDTGTDPVSGVVSEVAHLFTVGPEIVLESINTSYTPPSQNASSSYQATLRFRVIPRGGVVYMGTTTNPATNFADFALEKSDGTTSTPTSLAVKLYLGSTEVTNSQTVQATTSLWVLNEGSTYTFELVGSQVGAPGGVTGLYRWMLSDLRWTNDPNDAPAPAISSSWVRKIFLSSFQQVQ